MMRASTVGLLALFCVATFTGCSDPTPESVADEMTAKMNEVSTTLKGVTDESSAKAANDKLKSIAADMKKLKAQMDKLPKPTAEQEKKMEEKHGKEVAASMQTIVTEGMRKEAGAAPKSD